MANVQWCRVKVGRMSLGQRGDRIIEINLGGAFHRDSPHKHPCFLCPVTSVLLWDSTENFPTSKCPSKDEHLAFNLWIHELYISSVSCLTLVFSCGD